MRHPTQTAWIATTDDAVLNPADVLFATEAVDGVMLVGTLDGELHTCPQTVVPGLLTIPVHDNCLTVERLTLLLSSQDSEAEECGGEDSEAGDSEAEGSEAEGSDSDSSSDSEDEECEAGECEAGDSEAGESEAKDSESKGSLDPDMLLRVYLNPTHVDAVMHQCDHPDEDGDYSYCLLSASGEERIVFTAMPVAALAECLGLPVPHAVVNYSCPLLDRRDPAYVASIRPSAVTCYANHYPVPCMGAYVDVWFRSGYTLRRAFVTGECAAAIQAICQPDDSTEDEPPAKRRCLRPRA